MNFTEGEIYHIYNRGNKRDKIFFKEKNYLFFLEKLKIHVHPHADIIAWCLMPNHFHLMVKVNKTTIEIQNKESSKSDPKSRNLNQSIGIMLRSYTNAIQIQENITGSLFQQKTKSICLSELQKISPSYFNTEYGTMINNFEFKSYEQICFEYIHLNPVKAKLVDSPEKWEFSSYKDYAGLRNGRLVNRELGMKYFEETIRLIK